MAKEIEVKLNIPDLSLSLLEKHPVLSSFCYSQSQQYLSNRYFDTTDCQLKQLGYALRIRTANHQHIQTLKNSSFLEEGLHQRDEWSAELSSPEIDLSLLPKEIQKQLLPIEHQLRPLFNTDFKRQLWLLKCDDGTRLEMVLDQGQVLAKQKAIPFREVEIELITGGIETLLALSKQLQTDLKLTPENTSKAERGYQLFLEQI